MPQSNSQERKTILLNTIHPDLATHIDPLRNLANHLGLSLEEIHEGLVHFEMRSFTAQRLQDRFCNQIESIEQDLLQIERNYGATLQQLAQTHRIVILIEGFDLQPHIEVAMALTLLVTTMSGNLPDILSIHFDENDSSSLEVLRELKFQSVSKYYSSQTQRQVLYPKDGQNHLYQQKENRRESYV